MPSDFVHVGDSGRVRLKSGLILREWDDRSVVEVKGWVRALCRERGKIVPGSYREGHNIWTNTGREFLAMLMTYAANGSTPQRNDRIFYLGVGAGLQTEDATVVALKEPMEITANRFLVSLDHSATDFPLRPTRTTVRYVKTLSETDLTFGEVNSRFISELGLFTNGHQNSFEAGQRAIDKDSGPFQSPAAYKSLVEPIEKTQALEFQVEWEIRF
jgi:hypothetical protein